MNREELINNLMYLIDKYIPEGDREKFKPFLLMDDVPVKGILADFNRLSRDPIDDIDGDLVRKIYFHFC